MFLGPALSSLTAFVVVSVHLRPRPEKSFTQWSFLEILHSFHADFYQALGSHSWNQGPGQGPDLDSGRSWLQLLPAGIRQAQGVLPKIH